MLFKNYYYICRKLFTIMNTRLQQFLIAENLTQSQFADSINVARANISHILAGRNKPGFDFIENLAKRYPALNIEWFITGKGRMYKTSDQQTNAPQPEIPSLQPELFDRESIEPTEIIPLEKPAQTIVKEKIVNKIVVFYTDGTFEEFTKE